MAGITGLGGTFLKFKDPKAMNRWYKEVLGMNVNDYGVLFGFNHKTNERAFLQLGTFEDTSTYFGKDSQRAMLNFRVSDMETYLKELASKDVNILDEIESYEYGKFVHIEDPEGNRVELWEPVDSVFEASETFQDMA